MILRRVNEWPSWDWSPFGELDRMRRDMDLIAQGLTAPFFREPLAGVFPLMNITEDDNNYYVRAELPGIKADDLDISVTGDTLSLSGERQASEGDEGAKYHRREREAGKFSRAVSLPSEIDKEKVEASCTDGILTVVLPKAEKAKPKRISVKTS